MASPWKRGSGKPERPEMDGGQWDADEFSSFPDDSSGAAAPGEGEDEWALLRSTPDYDSEEMSAVGTYLQPSAAVIAAAQAPPMMILHPAPEAASYDVGHTGWDTGALAFTERAPEGRWPEAGNVAGMAFDLLNPGGTGAPGKPLSAGGGIAGGDWSVLPPSVAADGSRDLLATALAAGERAGLLASVTPTTHAMGEGSAPLGAWSSERGVGGVQATSSERRAVSAPSGALPGERWSESVDEADLLDKALAAGQRAGLMDRWG